MAGNDELRSRLSADTDTGCLHRRKSRKPDQPQTPDAHTKCSKRCFDGLLRSWRRRLHVFDPPGAKPAKSKPVVDIKPEESPDRLTKANLEADAVRSRPASAYCICDTSTSCCD